MTGYDWSLCDDQAVHAFDPSERPETDQSEVTAVCGFVVLACDIEPTHLGQPCWKCLVNVGEKCPEPGRAGRAL